MKPEPVPRWAIFSTVFIAIGICCAGLILTGPMYVAYLPSVPRLPVRAARPPTLTPVPTFTPLPPLPSSTPTAIAFKDIPGVAEYSLAMMDQQVIIHDSADRITGLFEDAVTAEQINTYDIMDEVENIRAAYQELRLLQPPPVLAQTHSGILTASEKCDRSMDYMAEWVEKARAGRGDEGEEFQEFGRLIIECRDGLNEVTTELVRQLRESPGAEAIPTLVETTVMRFPTMTQVEMLALTPEPTRPPQPSRAPDSGGGERFVGQGDSVLNFSLIRGGAVRFTFSHTGERNFIVELVDTNGNYSGLVANEIGNADGETIEGLESGDYFLRVQADGQWLINVIPE